MRVTQPGGFEKVPFSGKGLGLWRRRFSPWEPRNRTIYGIARVELYERIISSEWVADLHEGLGKNPRGTQTFIFSHPLRAVSAPQSDGCEGLRSEESQVPQIVLHETMKR